jgi:hypothetical protein
MRGFLVSAIAAFAALWLVASPSAGDVTNTWSGTWQNSAPDGSFWVFTQSGGGVGGVWKGNPKSGTLSGTIQGSTLTGTLVNNEAGQSASFSISLAPDGHSFSGTFTVVGGSTGQWISACSGGACQSNAAPPPPPPGGPPGGGAPGQSSPKLLAAASAWGQVGPATALAPGDELVATSPPIGARQRGATVSLSGDVSGETAVVLGTPQHTSAGMLKGGDCVLAAVGYFHFQINHAYTGNPLVPPDEEEIHGEALINATRLLTVCLDLVRQEAQQRAQRASLAAQAGPARVSCRLQARALKISVDDSARTIKYRTRKPSHKEPVRLLRGACHRASNGTVTLKIRTASKRIKLRKVVGPRLVVGAYRSSRATGTANMQTTFKRR